MPRMLALTRLATTDTAASPTNPQPISRTNAPRLTRVTAVTVEMAAGYSIFS